MRLRWDWIFLLWLVLDAGLGIQGADAPTNLTQSAETSGDVSTRIYTWLESQQLPNGLIESSEKSNMCSLYDNSLALMAFSVRGDFKRAEGILDFFQSRLKTEMKAAPGGFGQFRGCDGNTFGPPHRWLGDNAWLLIAINNYHKLAGNQKYREMAETLEAWIRSLEDKGGVIWGGFEEDGRKIGPNPEGMLDAFNAVPGFDDFHGKFLRNFKLQHWQPKERTIRSSSAVPQHRYALDLLAWGYCAFPGMTPEILRTAELCLTTKTSQNGKEVTGFCFDQDHDNVWLEGTGQMVVAYNTAGQADRASTYLTELEKAVVPSRKDPELIGIPYTTNPGTHFGDFPLWNGAESNPCVSSAAWYLFGRWKFDPMALGQQKDIPPEYQFWILKPSVP